MESRLVILTCQTNNNTKNANVPLAISTCQLFRSTWDPNVQYPHTNFKHTLDLGPDPAILESKTKTHSLVGILSFPTSHYATIYN
jgi:hypothetical protein